MSTQIFISSNNNACKPEFTKIASHSLAFRPTLDNIASGNEATLWCGGKFLTAALDSEMPVWSDVIYNVACPALSPRIRVNEKTIGIPLPMDLRNEDVVTLSGNLFFESYKQWVDAGYTLIPAIASYQFSCNDSVVGNSIPAYTFIPGETFTFDQDGGTCFKLSVKLNSGYKGDDTRIIVGFNVFATCDPTGTPCIRPVSSKENVAVTYSLDIERPCDKVADYNFLIKNCCEPILTELVNAPNLQVGSFYSDSEGNCWEVIDKTKNVTNFTRNFADTYTSCIECQTANPCPDNLKIESCCVPGQEYVSSAIPGLNVNDHFVDNHGLCWRVTDTTSFPISEESITIASMTTGNCIDCTDAHPCPDLWSIQSCCTRVTEVISTTIPLTIGESFVDTTGICWQVIDSASILPTNYNIVVDTVYSLDPESNCELCTNDNACPLEYFLTVRACCDPDRVEIMSIPAQYMTLSEGTIFSDLYGLCWEVMYYSTTGIETYAVDWSVGISTYKNCEECSTDEGKILCTTVWEVRDCADNTVYRAYSINNILTIGSYYTAIFKDSGEYSCFEVLGYGYPQSINEIVEIDSDYGFAQCEECALALPGLKTVELQPCCGGPNVIATTAASVVFQFGSNNVYSLTTYDFITTINQCYILLGFSTATPTTEVININKPFNTSDPAKCLDNYPCE